MIESNDILGRKNEIKGFVATAKLDKAVIRCIDLYRDFCEDEEDSAILISTTWYLIIEKEKTLEITPENVIVQKQQVAKRILQVIKDFPALQSQTW